MDRSLLDTVDLDAVRAAADGGRFGVVLACLVDGNVIEQDPDDPTWSDRDRLFVGAPAAVETARAAFRRSAEHADDGWVDARSAGPALGLAYGAAVASALDGGIFRVYAVVDEQVVDDGRSWEILRSAGAGERADSLTVVSVLTAPFRKTFASMLAATGWATASASAGDPIEVLGALDQARTRSGRPTAVLAVAG